MAFLMWNIYHLCCLFPMQLGCLRSRGELALSLFVTTWRLAGFDKVSQHGFYLLVLGTGIS